MSFDIKSSARVLRGGIAGAGSKANITERTIEVGFTMSGGVVQVDGAEGGLTCIGCVHPFLKGLAYDAEVL